MPSHAKICKKLLYKILCLYECIDSLSLPMQQQIDAIKKSKNIDWAFVSFSLPLSEAFIREFQDKVNWQYISYYQTLSESFIIEFKDKVDWRSISEKQKLSENFIKEFKDKVNWGLITQCQHVSANFINENMPAPVYINAIRINVPTFNLPDVLTVAPISLDSDFTVLPLRLSTIDGYCVY